MDYSIDIPVRVLTSLARIAGKRDTTRPYLHGVHIEPRLGWACATDGAMLLFARIEHADAAPLTVPCDAIKSATRGAGKNTHTATVTYRDEGTDVSVRVGAQAATGADITRGEDAREYPPILRVVPSALTESLQATIRQCWMRCNALCARLRSGRPSTCTSTRTGSAGRERTAQR